MENNDEYWCKYKASDCNVLESVHAVGRELGRAHAFESFREIHRMPDNFNCNLRADETVAK
jgi:hypothetical protein